MTVADELIPHELLDVIGRPAHLYREWLKAAEDPTVEAPSKDELAEAFAAAYDAIVIVLEPLSPDGVRVHATDFLWEMIDRYSRWDKDARTIGAWTEANVRLGNAWTRLVGELGRLKLWRTPDGAIEILPIDVTVPDYPPAP